MYRFSMQNHFVLAAILVILASHASGSALLMTSYVATYEWDTTNNVILAGSASTSGSTVLPSGIVPSALGYWETGGGIAATDDFAQLSIPWIALDSADLTAAIVPRFDVSPRSWDTIYSVNIVTEPDGDQAWAAIFSSNAVVKYNLTDGFPSTVIKTSACPVSLQKVIHAVPLNSTHYSVSCMSTSYDQGGLYIYAFAGGSPTLIWSSTTDYAGCGTVSPDGYFYFPSFVARKVNRYNIATGALELGWISTAVPCSTCSSSFDGLWRMRMLNDGKLYGLIYVDQSVQQNCLVSWDTATKVRTAIPVYCQMGMYDFLFLPGAGNFPAPYRMYSFTNPSAQYPPVPPQAAPQEAPQEAPQASPQASPQAVAQGAPVAAPVSSNVAPATTPTEMSARIVMSSDLSVTPDTSTLCNRFRQVLSVSTSDCSCIAEFAPLSAKKRSVQQTNHYILLTLSNSAGVTAYNQLQSDPALRTSLLASVGSATSNSYTGVEIQFNPTPLVAAPTAGTSNSQPQSSDVGAGGSGAFPIGAVVGGVVGGLALVIIVVVIIVVVSRRKKRDGPEQKQHKMTDMAPQANPEPEGQVYHPFEAKLGESVSDSENEKWIVEFDDLDFGKLLGQGAYGQVCAGTWRGSNVAIKRTFAVEKESFMKEANLMKRLRPHKNVVQTYGVCMQAGDAILVMEYCSGGALEQSLQKRQQTNTPLTDEEKIKLAHGIASGMIHLHAEKILHRDLAARNILIGGDGEPKISDFGMSFKGDSKVRKNEISLDVQTEIKDAVGPIRWMAPESLSTHVYSVKTDVYSFGILLWEILSDGKIPLEEVELNELAIRRRDENLVPEIPENAPPVLASICTSCWEKDPDLRPTFKMIARKLQKFIKLPEGADPGEMNTTTS